MDQQVTQESYRAGRYLVVRIISRVGDAAIFGFLVWLWGIERFVPALTISVLFNYVSDFFGQKLWTFKNLDTTPKEIAKEFGFYMLIRGGNVACAAGLWLFLYEILGVHWLIAAAIVIAVFWTVVFSLYRYLFIGSFRDLVAMVRRAFKTRSL